MGLERNPSDNLAAMRTTPPVPMTLGNMRQKGVRSLIVTCSNVTCRHEAIVNVDAYSDDLFVPSLGLRMRCERCGQRGADVRPNWFKSR
jgi:hypothetical protein